MLVVIPKTNALFENREQKASLFKATMSSIRVGSIVTVDGHPPYRFVMWVLGTQEPPNHRNYQDPN